MPEITQTWTYVFNLQSRVLGSAESDVAYAAIETRGDITTTGQISGDQLRDGLINSIAAQRGVDPAEVMVSVFTFTELSPA